MALAGLKFQLVLRGTDLLAFLARYSSIGIQLNYYYKHGFGVTLLEKAIR